MKDSRLDLLIIGCGPAGLGAAITAKKSNKGLNVAIFDSGRPITRRHCPLDDGKECRGCNNVCNVISGFGGSIHNGDGLKLSKFPSGRRLKELLDETDQAENEALDILGVRDLQFTYPTKETSISLKKYPIASLESSQVTSILTKLEVDLYLLGIPVYYSTEVIDIVPNQSSFKVYTSQKNGTILDFVLASKVVVASGRKGLFWWRSQLRKLGLSYEIPTISMGVRVEVQTEYLEKAAAAHLDYKCSLSKNDHKFKTFCFCSGDGGGKIKLVDYGPWSLLDGHVTPADRTNTSSNFALLMQLRDNLGQPLDFDWVQKSLIQRYMSLNPKSPGKPFIQSLSSFLNKQSDSHYIPKFKPSLENLHSSNVHELFPENSVDSFIEALNDILKSIALYHDDDVSTLSKMYTNAHVIGLELESLWDVVKTTRYMETDIANLFCCGDCAGSAQGVVQAMVSGIVAGKKIGNG